MNITKLTIMFVMNIFNAAKNVGVNYIDMALSLSIAHPTDPFNKVGVKLGDDQFAQHDQWLSQGNFALIGIGIEPGMSDIFARYAQDYLFSEIDAVTILDGSSLTVDGYEFAPSFSIWTTIEECLNPPLIWNEGWHTAKPFTGGVTFDFPEGIGLVECVDVEHEEVALIPQKIKAKKVTFKYGLGNDFIEKLKTIHALGLSNHLNKNHLSTIPVKLMDSLQFLRKEYAERKQILQDSLTAYMPNEIRWNEPRGGFYIWLKLPERIKSSTIFKASLDRGVAFVTGRTFDPDNKKDDRIRLSFSNMPKAEIKKGTKILAEVIRQSL